MNRTFLLALTITNVFLAFSDDYRTKSREEIVASLSTQSVDLSECNFTGKRTVSTPEERRKELYFDVETDIIPFLKANKSIEELNLSYCKTTPEAINEIFKAIDGSALKILNLSHVCRTEHKDTDISKIIKSATKFSRTCNFGNFEASPRRRGRC